jgi:6-pyruvoyltetrahydropterin/6-carboxytetrahydropterin synthase
LHWEEDELIRAIGMLIANEPNEIDESPHWFSSMVSLPFNPTAENLAAHMVEVVGPQLLAEHGVKLVKCVIEETSKCHVGYTK